MNFADDKHQQIQNLQHFNQLNQQLRQIDPLGSLSQQLQQNMDPIHLSQQLSQLQQLNHLQNQGVTDSHQQNEGEYLQNQLRQLSKLMDDHQQQSTHEMQSCLNGRNMADETELQKTLKAALQQRTSHAQPSSGEFPPTSGDKLNELDD